MNHEFLFLGLFKWFLIFDFLIFAERRWFFSF